jgi:hypothetical protein
VLNREHAQRRTLNSSAAMHLENLGALLPPDRGRVRDLAVHVSALNKGLAGIEHPDNRQAEEARLDVEPLWAEVRARAIKARAGR